MSIPMNATLGPYRDWMEARTRLSAFTKTACGPGVGICWASNGIVYPLRPPLRDAQGFGDVAIFQWTPAPVPRRPVPMDWRSRGWRFLNYVMTTVGEAKMAEAKANMAMGQAAGRALHRMFTSHQDDGLGVALDIICVVASLALLPEIAFLGAFALAGSAILLATDGSAYGMELAGEDGQAEEIKKLTESLRLFATVMTLPDLAFGGFKAIREFQTVRGLRAASQTTARTAEALGARTGNAARATRYEVIAQRANQRTQIRTKQLQRLMRLELGPRGAGAGSTGLIVREEILNDESALHAFVRRLNIHIVSTHK